MSGIGGGVHYWEGVDRHAVDWLRCEIRGGGSNGVRAGVKVEFSFGRGWTERNSRLGWERV